MTLYLSNRLQYVSFNNANSNSKPVKIGVSQCFVLGSLLFFTYIIVLHNYMFSVPRLFADSTAVVVRADSLQNLKILLYSELSKINISMNKNKITINLSKFCALVIHPTLAVNISSTGWPT